ncbi:MAG: AraC family transcriptional regulator [Beijerinckiaceae bacterium]|nr:AraC family transcriptional regulator [Beijerinckiaceae bacterium]
MMHQTLGHPHPSATAVLPRMRRADLDDIRAFIERNYAERLALEDLAERAGLSVFRFVTLFRRRFGVSPYRFLSMVRVQAAQQLLLDGTPPAIAAIEVGFCDQSHLCRHFRSLCGTTPGRFLADRIVVPVASNTNSRRAVTP